MKAKQYVQNFQISIDGGCTREIALKTMFTAFMKEFSNAVLDKNKQAKRGMTISGFDGVLREYDQKWRAVARMLDLREDGFMNYVRDNLPNIWEAHRIARLNERKG